MTILTMHRLVQMNRDTLYEAKTLVGIRLPAEL